MPLHNKRPEHKMKILFDCPQSTLVCLKQILQADLIKDGIFFAGGLDLVKVPLDNAHLRQLF